MQSGINATRLNTEKTRTPRRREDDDVETTKQGDGGTDFADMTILANSGIGATMVPPHALGRGRWRCGRRGYGGCR